MRKYRKYSKAKPTFIIWIVILNILNIFFKKVNILITCILSLPTIF